MDTAMELTVFLAYATGLLLVYVFGKLLFVPTRMLLKMLGNSILGGIFIIFVNLCGENSGICIPFNLVSAITVGILGFPGAALLIFLNF